MKPQKSFIEIIKHDLPAGLVVFLVAVPLCLGIALASGAPLYSGMIAGIVGGIVVSLLSKSQISVSGPAAGLTAIVISSISQLGSFETFLLAVVIAGVLQVIAGFLQAGTIANYFPSNVIKGMLTAIGIIIIMKQIPHAFGYDKDSEGDMEFLQSDGENTFSELLNVLSKIDFGATVFVVISLAIIIIWDRPFMKRFSKIPGSLVAVVTSVILNELFLRFIPILSVGSTHRVNIPVPQNATDFLGQFMFPNFSALENPHVYSVAFTIAIVASIETLLSLEAADKIDKYKRVSPPNRELKAQGFGNIISGMLGGLPLTSVIVRTSANVNAGAKTKMASFFHGLMLLISIALIPSILNMIPLSSLAAILLTTGFKLAKPQIFKEMFQKGIHQWAPFVITILAIVFSDLLIGVAIGLSVSIFAVLRVNYKNPYYFQKTLNKNGETIKIELAQEVSFLNKANIAKTLNELPENSRVTIDGSKTKYIDPDVVEILKDFRDVQSFEKKINVLLTELPEEYNLNNTQLSSIESNFSDANFRTAELQKQLTPEIALQILKEGNFRFANSLKMNRNLLQQASKTSRGQFPFAVILSCIDSRGSAELIFDQGLGDIFSIRIAGNIINDDVLGSIEFACSLAGAKIVVVLGHTSCGAVKGACDNVKLGHLTSLIAKLRPAVLDEKTITENRTSENLMFVDRVAHINVQHVVNEIKTRSNILNEMIQKNEVAIIGAMHDVDSGIINFLK